MELRANFLLVGLFVAATLLAALKFVYFIIGPALTSERKIYELAITGPAAGLSSGSEVRFNGMKVGEVTRIFMSESNPDQVTVLIEVEKATPIRTNTKALVTQSSLIGSALISFEGVAENAPAVTALPGHRYPRLSIKGAMPSDFIVSFEDLSLRLSRTAVKAKEVLGVVPPSFSAIKWDLEAASRAFKTEAPASGAPTQAMMLGPQQLATLSAYLDKLTVAAETFNKKPVVEDMVNVSAKLNKASATDLERLQRLAVQLREKVDAFDNSIRRFDLAPSTPRLENQTAPDSRALPGNQGLPNKK